MAGLEETLLCVLALRHLATELLLSDPLRSTEFPSSPVLGCKLLDRDLVGFTELCEVGLAGLLELGRIRMAGRA